MGIFDKIFSQTQVKQQVNNYFDTLTAYQPTFNTFEGGVYEMDLTRAAIHSFASHCSKLKIEVKGSAYKNLANRLNFKPNPYMDTSKFLYRLATILSVNNTAFIIPLYDRDEITITGLYPVLPNNVEIKEYKGVPFLVFNFNGKKASVELERVGIITNFQYKSDFFGESNYALNPTMELINTQNQGIVEGVKRSASIRFLVRLSQMIKEEDITKFRKRLTEEQLTSDNNGGVLVFDNKVAEVKQIDSKPFIIDDKQMSTIKQNVFNYFGTNEKILNNNYTEDEWNAFYEGKIEPFAVQVSLVLSNMLFTEKELAHGNQVVLSANRLQYASSNTKLAVSTQLFDRGLLTRNEIRVDIWNMSPIDDGDKTYIRLEYVETNKINQVQTGGNEDDNTGQKL